jgi:AraC family transcriptional regulator of adaptative response/methylated-DNA-[protein]-cysteine methyltransferase
MAATARGVCFAQFGESERALRDQLRSEFPKATLTPSPASGAPALDAWIKALDSHLRGQAARPDLPLDLHGTAFQLRVWAFLLSVKEGAPISYSELAAGIGAPKAVRAAASACARNRVAVLVPCHRVLRGDGDLGGYRWGLARKRALLAAEKTRAKR